MRNAAISLDGSNCSTISQSGKLGQKRGAMPRSESEVKASGKRYVVGTLIAYKQNRRIIKKEDKILKLSKKIVLVAFVIVVLPALTAFAGPIQKRVNFTIDSPFKIETGNSIMPPGDYVLYQINRNNTKLFALYQDDLTEGPVAMIQTVRVGYLPGEYPEESELFLNTDEQSDSAQSVAELIGWTIPGLDGWEVISVVEGNGY
jgi:hypothetical protein